jgi:DNA polymerase
VASNDWAASALKWWQDAGVDTIVGEEPHDWLNPKPAAAALGPAVEAVAAPPLEVMPDTLADFQDWLLTSVSLPLTAPLTARVAPAGDPASGLMVMVDMPSSEGGLMSAEAGALFDRMMAAIGRSRDSLYLAALSPVRTATGRLDAAAADALAGIARHHVGLAAPRALLLFGDACAKALIGTAVAGARSKWHALETPAGPVRTLVTISPAKLVTQPGLKKLAWEDLQMLQKELEA